MRLRLVLALVGGVVWGPGCGDDSSGQPIASTSSDGTTGTTGASSTGSTGSPDTSGSTTGADEGTTAAASDTTGSPTTGSGTTDGSDSGSSDSGSSTGPGVPPCEAGCVVEVACGMRWPTEDDCVMACEANLVEAGLFSRFCQGAWEGVSECIATLTCEEFVEWSAPMAFPYPCADADVDLQVECEGQ